MIMLVMPVQSYLPNPLHIYTLNLIFFMSFVVSMYGCLYLLTAKKSTGIVKIDPGEKQLKFNILLSSLSGITGFLFIFYDRVFIRGIDYTAGLRAARYQWLRETTGGSIFSVVGNLIIPLAYVSLFLFLVHGSRIDGKGKALLLISSFLGILGHAALNGGRSNLLIAISIIIVIYIFKAKSRFNRSKKVENKKIIFFSTIITCSFVIYMTSQSAVMGGVSLHELAEAGIESLYGNVTENFTYFTGELSSLILYITSYLFHGSWTAEALPSIQERPGSYLFYPISVLLAGLHLLQKPIEVGYFSESGAFISFPGAVFYDFGYLGVFGVGLMLGCITSIATFWLVYKRVSFIAFGLCLFPLVMVIMAPILPAYGLMYFNFVIYAFILLGLINAVLFKNRVSWL